MEDQMESRKVITAEIIRWSVKEADLLSKIWLWSNLGLCLWFWDKATILQLAHHNVTPKERVIGHKISAERLPPPPPNLGVVHRKFIPVGQTVNSALILKFSEVFEDCRWWENGETVGSCTMSMCLVTPLFQWSGEKPNSSYLSAIVFSTYFTTQLLALPETQDGLSGLHFVSTEETQQNMTAGLTAITRLPEVLQAVAGPLEQVCMCRRAVPQWQLGVVYTYLSYYRLCWRSRTFLILCHKGWWSGFSWGVFVLGGKWPDKFWLI